MQPLVYVVDVGQGSCNVIVLGKTKDRRGNRAIVIDCGPVTTKTPLEILRDAHVEWVDALIVSHNDQDHYGGVSRILAAYKRRIGRTYYVADREPTQNEVFKLLKRAHRQQWIKETPRVIAIEHAPVRIFPFERSVVNPTTKILVLAPQGHELEEAKAAGDPNQASAVFVLKCGKTTLVFPGDATIANWKGISRRRKGRPIDADLFVIPHHGGHLNWPDEQVKENYSWLLSKVVKCRYGVISVGTNNRDNHPRMDVLAALYRAEVRVICTEATQNCANCGMNELMDRKAKSVKTRLPSHATRDAKKVPCAGTIAIDVRHDSLNFVDVHDAITASDWATQQTDRCPISR